MIVSPSTSSLPFEITHYNKLKFEDGIDPRIPEPDVLPVALSEPRREKEFKSLKNASLDAEYEMVLKALEEVDFNKSKAAKLLNIDRKTIYNILNQYKKIKQL